MKILYIDSAKTLENIRIAEQKIFCDELPKLNNDIYFLLPRNKNVIENNNVFTYKYNFFARLFINIPILIELLKIIRSYRLDFIVTRNEIPVSFTPLVLSKIYKISFVYIKAYPLTEMFFYNFKNEYSLYRRFINYLKYCIYNMIEHFILHKADVVLPRTKAYLDYLSKSKKIDIKKMYALPMGFDNNSIIDKNYNKNKLYKKYCPNNEKLVIYFGTLHKRRKLEFLLRVFKKINEKRKDVKLLLIGGTHNDHIDLRKITQQLNIQEYVYFEKQMKRYNLNKFIDIAHISVSAIPPIFIYKISSPTKVIESLGLKTPVLANIEIQDQKEVIEASGAGRVVPYDENIFANALLDLLSDPIKLEKMGKKGLDYVYKNRTYAKLAYDLYCFLNVFSNNKLKK